MDGSFDDAAKIIPRSPTAQTLKDRDDGPG
jgi:hypothetical protein